MQNAPKNLSTKIWLRPAVEVVRSVALPFNSDRIQASRLARFVHSFMENFFPLLLVQEEQVVSYRQKNDE